MNTKNLRFNVGFVTAEEIFERLAWRTPPDEGYWMFSKIEGTSFSELSVVDEDGAVVEVLFRIWTKNQSVYRWLRRQIIDQASKFNKVVMAKAGVPL